jgi:hypothetical protein
MYILRQAFLDQRRSVDRVEPSALALVLLGPVIRPPPDPE